MIPKPDFSDYHKFRVSTAVALMAIGPIIVWLVLRESYDLFRTTEDIDNLTTWAKWIVYARQFLSAAITVMAIASAIWLFFIGLSMFRSSDAKWKEMQDIHDEILILDRDAKKAGLRDQSIDEINQSVADDMAQSQDIDSINPTDSSRVDSDSTVNISSLKKELELRILVSGFIKKVRYVSQPKYLIRVDQMLRNTKYDIVLRALNDSYPDLLVEVRVWESFDVYRLKNLIQDYATVNEVYANSLGRLARTLLIVVTDDEKSVTQSVRSLRNYLVHYGDLGNSVAIVFISKTRFAELPLDQTLELLESQGVQVLSTVE